MTTEPDGVGEATEEMLRVALLMATRVAHLHQQHRADRLATAARASQEAAALERSRQTSVRDGAIRSLTGVSSTTWWDHADAEDIRQVWGVAREYQGQDSRADRAVYRIADELKSRYGLDVTQSDPELLGQQPTLSAASSLTVKDLDSYDQQIAARLEQLERERASSTDQTRLDAIEAESNDLGEIREMISEDLADRQQHRADGPGNEQRARRERAEVVDAMLITGADGSTAEPLPYDSVQRRDELRERLERADVPERAVDARVLSDIGQGKPAHEALSQDGGEQAKARPAGRNPRGRAPSRQRTR
jgi:DNA-binding protein H-NS